MAAGSSAATEAAPAESGREHEKTLGDGEQEKSQDERGQSQQQTGQTTQSESDDNRALPPLPPRPLPVTHHESSLKHPQVLPPPRPVHFGPLPVDDAEEAGPLVRPYYPRWHKTKLALLFMSMVVCAVIFGVGVAMGFHNAPFYDVYPSGYGYFGDTPADYGFGISGAAAGAAVLVSAIELLTTCASRRRQGMRPGALVAFHLIIWLLALAAIVVVTIYVSDAQNYGYYDYPEPDESELWIKTVIYEQVLLGFDCILLVIHFVLFVGACVETNRCERSKSKVVMVPVPVPADGSYPGGQYPLYGPPRGFVPPSGAQRGQYPMMAQVPPQAGQGPLPPQQATLYGGYYAPAPPGMTWVPQQGANPQLLQGYYAPAPAPRRAASNPRRSSQRSSHRQSRVQPTDPPTQQPTAGSEQSATEGPVTEKTT